MKDDYRETTSGKTVKYDSDPTNDYSDGYNAGRRYEPPKGSKMKWLLLLLLLLLFLFFLSLLSWPFEKGASTQATPTVAPSSAPGAKPAGSITPSPTTSPVTHGATPTSATLPAVGQH